jgi:hypothetical protein
LLRLGPLRWRRCLLCTAGRGEEHTGKHDTARCALHQKLLSGEGHQYRQLRKSAPGGAVINIRSTAHGNTICGYLSRV